MTFSIVNIIVPNQSVDLNWLVEGMRRQCAGVELRVWHQGGFDGRADLPGLVVVGLEAGPMPPMSEVKRAFLHGLMPVCVPATADAEGQTRVLGGLKAVLGPVGVQECGQVLAGSVESRVLEAQLLAAKRRMRDAQSRHAEREAILTELVLSLDTQTCAPEAPPDMPPEPAPAPWLAGIKRRLRRGQGSK